MDFRLEGILNHLGIKDQWDNVGKQFEQEKPISSGRHCGKCTWPKKGRIRSIKKYNQWFNTIIGKFYYYETTQDGMEFHVYGDTPMDDGFFGPMSIGLYFDIDEIRNTLEDENGGFVYDEDGNEIEAEEENKHGFNIFYDKEDNNIKMEKSSTMPPAVKPKKVSAKRKKNAAIVAERTDPTKERFGTIEDIMSTREIL